MTRRARNALVALAVVVLLAIAGNMDYADAVREHAHYCARVADGTWPDYKKTFDEECS